MPERTDHNEAMRLADSIKTRAVGWTEWRVESPVDGSYVMVFTQAESLWPEKEASEWLALHKQHHPNSMYADYVVAKHHCYSKVEQDAIEAAALLRQLSAERDQLRAEVERLKPNAERWTALRASNFQMVMHSKGKRVFWSVRPIFTNYEYSLFDSQEQAVDSLRNEQKEQS